MSKYLKLYDNESQYLIAQSQQDFTQYKPNVVYCIGENKSHYNNIQSNDDMSQDEQYIIFEDQEVRRICSINWGDYRQTVTTVDDENNTTNIQVILYHTTPQGKQSTTIQNITRIKYDTDVADTVNEPLGITFTQAAAVSSIGTTFQNNTVIRKFNEFQYFTKVSSLSNSAFSKSGIAEITFPTSIRTIGQEAFLNCTNLSSMILNEGATTTKEQWVWGAKNIVLIDLPSTITTLTGYGIQPYGSSGQKNYNIICRATTPPTLGSSNYLTKLVNVYVPDNSVNSYKSASVWSNLSSKIVALSTYQS